MREVSIIGVGQTPVGEHWESGLRVLAATAIHAALQDAGLQSADALYVGNAFGAAFSSQSNVAALVADYSGLAGIETLGFELADSSGAAALRAGYLAVASGLVDTVIVTGVEKSSDMVGTAR